MIVRLHTPAPASAPTAAAPGPTLARIGDAPPVLTAAEIAARRACCILCDEYQPEPDRCRWCGCSGTIRTRTASPFQRCPADRWPLDGFGNRDQKQTAK